jgi:hypothetical protein
MKASHKTPSRWLSVFTSALFVLGACQVKAAPATLIFEDHFDGGVPGWFAVQPSGGIYIDGPMLWQYDLVNKAFVEQSNIYTDAALFSGSRIAVMLINDAVAPANFTYTARLMIGDDDGFGLIWGYEGEHTFYRVTFAQQNRALVGWPYQGWVVDRMNNGQVTDLFGPDNTAFIPTFGQPFDVTVNVNSGLLNLTIVDDPDGAAIVHNAVVDGALPTTPSARVGMFSWGMQPHASVRGFRIQNPTLSPTSLAGDLNSVLTNWSFLIPPRANGTTNMNGGLPPMWSMGFDANGPTGTLFENSDRFLDADNTANGTTNFAAPSAVAGDVTWSNYVYSARLTSEDDDGLGILFRYLNETNFYRMGFRSQNSVAGVKRGVSIQKNVDLNFDEIFYSTAFIYQPGVPFDVHASIQTNRLQVLVVNNPESTAAQGYFFGPFDITGDTVDQGKIGLFSWAQFSAVTARKSGTEVDFVKVYDMTGQGLIVNSPYGTPSPPVGLNDFPINTVITAAVQSVITDAPGVRRVLTGWNGFGSVPASGAANEVSFTLSTFSLLTWNWRTEYQLTTSTTTGGSVNASLGPWVVEGSNVTVTATANPGFMFRGWTGDSISTVATLQFPMVRPITLTALFSADSDGDGLADDWEIAHFGNLAQTAEGDPDGDGASNLTEFELGTNPNFAETLVVSDGLSSQWINTQRDPVLPSQLRVIDFGSGYRGAWDDSNDHRNGNDFAFIASTNFGNNASFQSPRVIVKSNLWNDAWSSNFSASIEFTVGDDDGNSFYFRYKDEQNWYRATLCGQDPQGATARPPVGLSVQRRLNGKYDLLAISLSGQLFAAYTDPTDGAGTPAGYKRVRLTVNATNENFEIVVRGWDFNLNDFDASTELIATFTDTNHTSGRIGFGLWGQGSFGDNNNVVNGIPVPFGAMVDNIVLKSPADGSTVFSENWETVALADEFPAGWSNPYEGFPVFQGDWRMSAHGTFAQQSNQGADTTGTPSLPKADADGPMLLAPVPPVPNYLLQVGFHPFDNDGIGFIYDFQDTNNYSRVMFRSEMTFTGDIPPGLSVSRKSDGVWTDVVAGDTTFLYIPGRPFEVDFANNNGSYVLLARHVDSPGNVSKWQWTGPVATPGNRFGVAVWASQDAHFTHVRALSLPEFTPIIPLQITKISVAGGSVVLDVSKPDGALYNVLRAASVTGPYSSVANNQSGAQYTEALPGATAYYRLELVP